MWLLHKGSYGPNINTSWAYHELNLSINTWAVPVPIMECHTWLDIIITSNNFCETAVLGPRDIIKPACYYLWLSNPSFSDPPLLPSPHWHLKLTLDSVDIERLSNSHNVQVMPFNKKKVCTFIHKCCLYVFYSSLIIQDSSSQPFRRILTSCYRYINNFHASTHQSITHDHFTN